MVPMGAAVPTDGFRVAMFLETLTGERSKGERPARSKCNVALNGESTGYKTHAEFNSDTGPRPRSGE